MRRIAVIRIRGRVGVSPDIKRTLELLNLKRKYNCVIVKDVPSILGMLKKVENYVTWGEIDRETMEALLRKRGRIGKKRLSDELMKERTGKNISQIVEDFMQFKCELRDFGIKEVFRLAPPSGGFERKGIKQPFKVGGALGYRGVKINELLRRMI
ncbi:MAG: 50S ribosomal protein L30 [Candidatus Nanoarchaeia archaeon]|nr:50S ribosomal protein L30 [Candidatus Haiyanarchaeum thermophilum]MCW1303120.1 50S ribosomal protein L30 [Candidatus Haiyanarchaeum thermophilum]MCW1303785.1 50S ribosomal protein L30 [Candidatus Haiyanarchaeum thermophilum]MCW1306600.1 50S ribosomal protein L30 [Candidatus Haiyanarchaeum thermophilum]MCW1307012.1 50S ribosomal protein L30 [Candidatus Haiyanarchaeum thermophilum]